MLPLNIPTLLRQFNLHAKKSLGQNFLMDEGALAKVAEAAELSSHDTVLEIGPGLGSLTRYLAQAAQRVVAVELDEALLPALAHVLRPFPNAHVVHGDILAINLSTLNLGANYKVVANIPYYITSAVVRYLLEAAARPAQIVLTMQREVAERICAGPGAMSLLAVSVQFYAEPRIVARIPAGAFYPKPEVDSAVIRLAVRPQPATTIADVDEFFRVVKAGFSQKRKQLRNALAGGMQMGPSAVDEWMARARLDPKRRAETLTLAEWGALARMYRTTSDE